MMYNDDLLYSLGRVGTDEVIQGDPFNYTRGACASDLRSGKDGPHTGLAKRECGLTGRNNE